jgi:hypothetical protein
MRVTWRYLGVIGGAFAILALLSGSLSSRQVAAQSDQHARLMALPASWVPFSAEMLKDGQSGRFARGSDGSTRWSIESPLGEIVTIHNVSLGQSYIKLPTQDAWSGMAFQGPTEPPPSLLLSSQAHELADRVAGLAVWEVPSGHGGGLSRRFLPGLNGFTMYLETRTNLGLVRTEEYYNIHLGEQPAELFLPPPSAHLREGTAPVFTPPSSR